MKQRHGSRATIAALALFFLCTCAGAGENEVTVRVVDTGPGLCTITTMPGPHYMVYDTGYIAETRDKLHPKCGHSQCLKHLKETIEGEVIHLLVLSHPDRDHLGAAVDILNAYQVKRILRTGMERNKPWWASIDEAVRKEAAQAGTTVIDMKPPKPALGETWTYGGTNVTFLNGWYEPPPSWRYLRRSEVRNALSIVIRVEHRGGSVLFTGDALGQYRDNWKAEWSERSLLDSSVSGFLRSNAIIAGHHGADDASSEEFINAVKPEWVVFSAGNSYGHPRWSTVQRYERNGVAVEKMLRTDLGGSRDVPFSSKEWWQGRDEEGDDCGDDHIELRINDRGIVSAEYTSAGP